MRVCVPLVLLLFGVSETSAQTATPGQTCENKNSTNCEDCLQNTACLWCLKTRSCITYPVRSILPPQSLCPLNDARWGLCSMNFQILIITVSVVAGVFIIAFFFCLFCCCKCENCGTSSFENRMQQQADKRSTKQELRKAEMRSRHDEIRQKYGLSKASPYARFENPA